MKNQDNNAILNKSKKFAIRCVNLYKYLVYTKKETILSKQLLRSGTSIGANVAESQQAQSTPDFITKLNISLKETSETKYWIRLLARTDYLTREETDSILNDCIEIEKMLVSIIKSTRKNNGLN